MKTGGRPRGKELGQIRGRVPDRAVVEPEAGLQRLPGQSPAGGVTRLLVARSVGTDWIIWANRSALVRVSQRLGRSDRPYAEREGTRGKGTAAQESPPHRAKCGYVRAFIRAAPHVNT
jgi:hypothetical protein